MNSFSEFIKSRFGMILVLSAILLLIVISVRYFGAEPEPLRIPERTNATVSTVIKRDVGSIPAPISAPVVVTNVQKRSSIILSIDVPLPAETNVPPGLFSPAGSQLFCELVNTLESIRIETPVIGRVVRDLIFDGKVIVPTGTKIFGKAQVDRVRDRIAAHGSWTLVFPEGEELVVEGLVQHREESVPGEKWGLDDGSAGFKGQVIKSTSFEEIKLFAASFLSGVSQGLQQTDSTIFGTQIRRSVKNSALSGSSAVLDEYAKSIAETIKRDGVYVRVPGGAQFTLYLPYFLDRSAARIGATARKN